MLGRLTERKRTLSLGFRMMLVSGVKVNLILQPLLWLILRKSTTTRPTRINEVIGSIPRCVTEDMNSELTKTFTRAEVLKAL